MLDAIKGGGHTLKPVEVGAAPPAAAEAGGRDGLMAQINQGGFKLKSAAERQLPAKEPPPEASTGTNDIAAELARRMKERHKRMDSDSEDSDDWDDDD